MYPKVKYVICAVGILIRLQVFAFHGYITTDTTRSDTMYVDGDVIVQENVVLTVDPGTHILFSPDTSVWDWSGSSETGNRCDLIVIGWLKLVSLPSDSIFFNTYCDSGGWGSIVLSSDTVHIIEYAEIKHARVGIKCIYSDAWIRDCLISNSARSDVSIGIYCRNSSPQIKGNTISNICGEEGDTINNKDGGEAYGIYCQDSNPIIGGSPYYQNNIYQDTSGTYNVVNLTHNDVITIYNWWGDTIADTIAEYIYDPWAPDSFIPAVVQWDKVSDDGRKVVSGIYFYILETNGIRTIKKMVVLE